MTVPTRLGLPPLADRVAGKGSSAMRDLLALTARPEVLSFAGGFPAPEIFDVDGLRAAFEEALAWPAAGLNLQYSTAEGLGTLRERVAERLTSKGLPTVSDEVLVTTGSQQALTLLATVLLDPGATILVEDPTYLSALQSFLLLGARAVAVDSDGHGILPDALEAALRRERPAALYLVPTFANPTGLTLDAQRRARIAELVAEYGVWLIEDDPYSELRFSGTHVGPISASPIVRSCALYLGTFSKIGCPGLRVGWVRAPVEIMPTLATVKQASDMHTSTLDQAATASYLRSGRLDGHIATVREVYRQRRDAMLAAMPATMPPGTRWTEPDGGMFLWVELPEGYDATQRLRQAMAERVAFVPGAQFHAERPNPRTLRMCFVTNEPAAITEGMARLARAFAAG
ncbi:MAG: PLP-dependent aminotransferase family protein [Dermatophilaceae bacterium]